MDALEVDERSTGWEQGDPIFRVMVVAPETGSTRIWDLHGASLESATAWADSVTSPGYRRSIGVLVERSKADSSTGVIWISGKPEPLGGETLVTLTK
jgi:hypothetical protein